MAGIKKDIQHLTEYLQDYMAGKEPERPVMGTFEASKLAEVIEILLENSGRMTVSSMNLMETASSLSTFDVGLAHISNGLKDEITIEVYHTPLIVNILAALVVLILTGGVIGGPIFLIVWLKKRVKKNIQNSQ